MTRSRMLVGAAVALAAATALLASASPAVAQGTLAAAQSTDLWGGPGARGTGQQGAAFDTTVYVSALAAATGTVDFYVGGALAESTPFSVPARGVAVLSTPAGLADRGAFLFRVRSDSAVTAWSETYNEASTGRFGVGVPAYTASELLGPGDEASGGGVDASSSADASRARTNVGVVCVTTSSQTCRIEVGAFQNGALLGSGTVEAIPGSAVQQALSALVPGAAEKQGLALRIRMLAGSGAPYAVKNNNRSSDGSLVPLSVVRGAFSTAPVITEFNVTPLTGCSPQELTITWAAPGAARVTISVLAGDLPASGTRTATILTSTDVVLTAYSASGDSSSQTRKATIVPATEPPTPVPATATLDFLQTVSGVLPFSGSQLTWAFTQQESSGSSFTVSGSSFVYAAGTTAGTDVVTLTADGVCGAATATFTATVVEPGAPRILTFTSDPPVSCRFTNDILVSWTTADVVRVNLTGADFALSANGSYGFSYPPSDLSTSKTYTLTAFGVTGAKVTKTLTVPIDAGLEYPVPTPQYVTVPAGSTVPVTISGVSNLQYLSWYNLYLPSGGQFRCISATSCFYQAGTIWGTTDVVKITYHNGCGSTFSEFKANVTQP